MVLEELGLTYESVYLDFSKKQHKAPEFTKYNPNGRIPALIDHQNGDFVIWESSAIVLYLELGLVLGCRSPCDAGIRSELRVRVRVTRDDESELTVAPDAKLGSGMGDFKMQASGVRVLASKMTSPQARGRQTQPRALGSSLALLANSHLCCNTRTVGLSFDSSTFDPFAGPLCAAESVRPSVALGPIHQA